MTHKLDILIVSFNTRDLTLACIDSVRRTTSSSHRIIVVDNASTDGSAEAIHDSCPDVRLICQETNLGFAGAVNQGAAQVTAPWLLLLNPDAIVPPSAIDGLLKFAENAPQPGIFGGLTSYPDGTINPRSCLMCPTLWSVACHSFGLSAVFRGSRLFDPEAVSARKITGPLKVDIVSGCLFLISTSLWRQLGGFDPVFFMYGEEADLCLRAARVGVPAMVTPAVNIVHLSERSAIRPADPNIQNAMARITLMRRYWPRVNRWAIRPLMWSWAATRRLGSALLQAISPSPSNNVRRDIWRTVWRERSRWLAGY